MENIAQYDKSETEERLKIFRQCAIIGGEENEGNKEKQWSTSDRENAL